VLEFGLADGLEGRCGGLLTGKAHSHPLGLPAGPALRLGQVKKLVTQGALQAPPLLQNPQALGVDPISVSVGGG
jgi:hypothetical protein